MIMMIIEDLVVFLKSIEVIMIMMNITHGNYDYEDHIDVTNHENMINLHVASSLPVAMASPLGWNFTLFMSDVWP